MTLMHANTYWQKNKKKTFQIKTIELLL